MSDDREALERVLGPLPATTEAIRELEDRWQVATYAKLPIALVRGLGATVEDVEGRRYLDLYGGHAVALIGHCHPRLVAALRAQAGRLLFYSNAVYNDVRALAVQRLAALAPPGLRRVFLCNSGAEANETALKLARKHTGRKLVLSMQEGFHGRTLGALGATGLAGYRDPAYPIPTEHRYVPYGDVGALEAAFAQAPGAVGAVLLEPIPSMGGIRLAGRAWFEALRRLCDAHGSLLVFDEVQTGFGRTGTNFYGEQVGVTPDLITGAKGIAGGFPAGVVFVRETIAATVRTGEQGTTFGGGPLASAAIAATAAVIVEEGLAARAALLGAALRAALEAVPGVRSVSGAGLLLGIDLDRPAKPVCTALREEGVLVGSSGDPRQIRLMPPLTLSEDEALAWVPTLRRILG